jgi:hypothetical protein
MSFWDTLNKMGTAPPSKEKARRGEAGPVGQTKDAILEDLKTRTANTMLEVYDNVMNPPAMRELTADEKAAKREKSDKKKARNKKVVKATGKAGAKVVVGIGRLLVVAGRTSKNRLRLGSGKEEINGEFTIDDNEDREGVNE